MSNFKIDRRRFMSSSGLILTLPLLESLPPFRKFAHASSATDPRRAVFLYMPNGTYNKSNDAPWHPSYNGPLTTNLPDVLAPFSANIADFSVLKQINHNARDQTDGNYYNFNGNGGGHVSAVSTHLSQQVISTPSSSSCSISRPSIDQIIAQNSGKPSLVMHVGGLTSGADNSPFDYSNYISFTGGKPVQPLYNPYDVYNKLLALVTSGSSGQSMTPVTAPAATPSPTPAQSPPPNPTSASGTPANTQKSILDNALADINDLKSQLGKTDQSKLDDFLTSLRNIESTIATTPTTGPTPTPTPGQNPGPTACTPPSAPASSLNNYGGENVKDYFTRVQAYFDMIVFAFQCDLVRSVSFMFDGEVGERILTPQVPANLIFNNTDLTAGMHIGIAHNGGRSMNVTKDHAYMSLMLYLVNKLKATTDASGSPVLDNSIIHMAYGVSAGDHGDGHSPTVVAGGRNFIHPGNSYDASSYDQKDLLYTIGNYMNVGITSFEGSSKLVNI
ncbi:MAG: hypothetical protein C5B49_06455 [Bdellovibrio sp.]|nr:MAG: hypothetical protein C5B49_06455 [Bdellovibrio sp.]